MRVLFVSGFPVDMPSVRYRCYHPQEQLTMLGWQADVVWIGDPAVRLNHDIVVFHQAVLDEHVEHIVERARSAGCALVYDMDDLTVGSDFFRHQAYKHAFSAEQMTDLIRTAQQREALLCRCDACLVSTADLADMVSPYGPPPFVLRNALGQQDFEIATGVKRHDVAAGGRIVLGYMSGTASHNYDFAEIADVLAAVMADHPQVYLQITGPLELSESLRRFGHRVRRLPLVPWEHLYGILASLDINLAPLELREPFCQAKSEVKYMEAGLVGVPTIASSIGAFQYAIRSGLNGFLASTAAEWRESLDRLIEAPDSIAVLGEAARNDVQQRYHPATRALELKAILEQIVAVNRSDRARNSRSDQLPAVIVRPDFGFPVAQRPPLLPLTRSGIKASLALFKRMTTYQGLLRTLWHFVTRPWKALTNLWRRARSLQ